MTDSLRVQAVVNTVLRHLEQREAKNDPVPGHKKTTTFKARGGAWFMISICLFCIGLFLWGLFSGSVDDFWGYAFFVFLISYMVLLLRFSTTMLRSKIQVGPEMLLLDGAYETMEHPTIWQRLKVQLFLTTPLVVEVKWESILSLAVESHMLKIETLAHQHFRMPLGFFDIRVISAISKYHKIAIE